MNPLYNRKLQSALIDTGKRVEAMENKPAPEIPVLEIKFNQFLAAVEMGDMPNLSYTTKELIAALVKWQIEKM